MSRRISRGNRSGPTKSTRAFVADLRSRPLPADPRERAVEEAIRRWAIAGCQDQRFPNNKRNLSAAFAAATRVLSSHLTTVHGIETKTERHGNGFSSTYLQNVRIVSRFNQGRTDRDYAGISNLETVHATCHPGS